MCHKQREDSWWREVKKYTCSIRRGRLSLSSMIGSRWCLRRVTEGKWISIRILEGEVLCRFPHRKVVGDVWNSLNRYLILISFSPLPIYFVLKSFKILWPNILTTSAGGIMVIVVSSGETAGAGPRVDIYSKTWNVLYPSVIWVCMLW